jgi:NADH dehydrogenase FAD-containing subunit
MKKRLLEENKIISKDAIIWATGPRAKTLFETSNLHVDKNNYLVVNKRLQSVSSAFIFASGDCASINEGVLAKNGVNAVRQAPVLYYNLKASVENSALREYKVNKTQLAIFSTGRRTAILHYGWVIWGGKIPWQIKNFIDQSYMKKHKNKF